MRARANEILTIEGMPQAEGAGLRSAAPAAESRSSKLMSAGPTPDTYPVGVHYDTACAGDTWLLVGARLFDPQRLSVNEDELPVMLVTAAHGAQ